MARAPHPQVARTLADVGVSLAEYDAEYERLLAWVVVRCVVGRDA